MQNIVYGQSGPLLVVGRFVPAHATINELHEYIKTKSPYARIREEVVANIGNKEICFHRIIHLYLYVRIQAQNASIDELSNFDTYKSTLKIGWWDKFCGNWEESSAKVYFLRHWLKVCYHGMSAERCSKHNGIKDQENIYCHACDLIRNHLALIPSKIKKTADDTCNYTISFRRSLSEDSSVVTIVYAMKFSSALLPCIELSFTFSLGRDSFAKLQSFIDGYYHSDKEHLIPPLVEEPALVSGVSFIGGSALLETFTPTLQTKPVQNQVPASSSASSKRVHKRQADVGVPGQSYMSSNLKLNSSSPQHSATTSFSPQASGGEKSFDIRPRGKMDCAKYAQLAEDLVQQGMDSCTLVCSEDQARFIKQRIQEQAEDRGWTRIQNGLQSIKVRLEIKEATKPAAT